VSVEWNSLQKQNTFGKYSLCGGDEERSLLQVGKIKEKLFYFFWP